MKTTLCITLFLFSLVNGQLDDQAIEEDQLMAPNSAFDRMTEMIYGQRSKGKPDSDSQESGPERIKREVNESEEVKGQSKNEEPERIKREVNESEEVKGQSKNEELERIKREVNGTESEQKNEIHFKNDGHDHSNDTITADGKVKKRCWGKKK